MGLFVLAGAAWLGGCSTFTCALRGLIGGVIIYLGARVALKLLASIVADTIVKAKMSQNHKAEKLNP
ncbi:MAG: hypothetical protein AMJ81_00435 [Phycisphaerae bacterium SM23_33]|nr:MAG: hypothetical protein AMJ81_00435 [Phycisphaerae bacterium SM23_33]